VLAGVNTRPRYEPAPPADPGAEPANANTNAVANAAAATNAVAAAASTGIGIGTVGTEAADAEIIGSSQDDPELFAVIFDRHADEIHRYAARRLDRQEAADVVSDVFLAAFRNRGRYDAGRADARPWLYGIATKVISQHMRAESRRARTLAALPVPLPAVFSVEEISDRITAAQLRPRLLRVLAGLSVADRELVLLVAWAELSYEQVAEALEIPVGTVRSRLHRVRAKIRRSIGPVGLTQ
jgi:RNA polymerase sigma factor (sigma-70 family)